MTTQNMRSLEAEAIHILREAAGGFAKPVLMFSIGKDSMALLHLAAKAFYPAPIPFPILHIDTTWKFSAMIAFRDEMARQYNVDLITHTNQDGVARGIGPCASGATLHTHVMKTIALKQALDLHSFDVAIGGARRDEEKSRAKERVFSVRGPGHSWDPRSQRPELWGHYNTRLGPQQTMRAFPLSNWTELDVWSYIEVEKIPVVPLYFAAQRPVVARAGTWIMADDHRLVLAANEVIETRSVRFRTLGCYPLSGAIESKAVSVAQVIAEMRTSRLSERQGRLIDGDGTSSMESKKREGYF
jgi:sulfate adenylyltransferase subunit 2